MFHLGFHFGDWGVILIIALNISDQIAQKQIKNTRAEKSSKNSQYDLHHATNAWKYGGNLNISNFYFDICWLIKANILLKEKPDP